MTKKELSEKLETTNKLLEARTDEIIRLRKMLEKERVCGSYCVNCIHHVTDVIDPFWERVRFSCDLDCTCPNFDRKT